MHSRNADFAALIHVRNLPHLFIVSTVNLIIIWLKQYPTNYVRKGASPILIVDPFCQAVLFRRFHRDGAILSCCLPWLAVCSAGR